MVIGLAVDPDDHVWISHRPRSVTPFEGAAGADPPTAICCVPAPAVIEFDPEGSIVQAWGGPRKVCVSDCLLTAVEENLVPLHPDCAGSPLVFQGSRTASHLLLPRHGREPSDPVVRRLGGCSWDSVAAVRASPRWLASRSPCRHWCTDDAGPLTRNKRTGSTPMSVGACRRTIASFSDLHHLCVTAIRSRGRL